jgi:protein O-GlcNAc transferase
MESAIALRPDILAAHSGILTVLSYAESEGEISYADAARRFAKAARDQIKKPLRDHAPSGAESSGIPGTKLRVGFVSGDLCAHPVGFFLNDVLKNLDRSRLHLAAYSNNPVNDSATESLKANFDAWHSIRDLNDDAAAELISSHHVDMLFDLGGHTGENRLAVFVRRPAPTQVTWLGYWASTGLDEMDFIIGDPISTPPDSTEWFSEHVYRLPHTRLCMAVPQTSREISIAEPPCQRNGFITFGSFQQVRKITDQVLSVWAKVLAAVPQSRLRIQTEAIGIPSMRDRLSQDMIKAGIDLSRVQLLSAYEIDRYLDAHNDIDILLDTFPYPGGTTTAFALWMGVPTITLAGNTMLSRQGASMLACVDLSDLVAHSEAEYVDTAVQLAGDATRLANLRRQLRAQALKSPLFDSKAFAKDFQEAIFQMHQERLQMVGRVGLESTTKGL